jgi:lysophospholipase L1-like esterase
VVDRRVRWRAVFCAVFGLVLAMTVNGCSTASRAGASPDDRGPEVTRDVRTLGVLGDSISLGVNACAQPGECRAASWVLGSDPAVDSLANRIEHQTGRRPKIANGAVSGGTVGSLEQTVGTVVAAKPQLVTILIGANDACTANVAAMTGADEFRSTYAKVLDAVLDGVPDARVLALSVPNLYRLSLLGQESPEVRGAWSQLGICGSLMGSAGAGAGAPQGAGVRQRVDDYNRAIAELCAARPRCIGDDGAVHAQSFTESELSDIDFFHPSRAGQRRLAQIAWAALAKAS